MGFKPTDVVILLDVVCKSHSNRCRHLLSHAYFSVKQDYSVRVLISLVNGARSDLFWGQGLGFMVYDCFYVQNFILICDGMYA